MFKKCILPLFLLLILGSPTWGLEFKYTSDAEALLRMKSLADRLVSASHLHLSYRMGIVSYDEVNAFAAGDSQIFLTRKLLRTLSTEEELAAVLAHELGHLSRRSTVVVIHSFNAINADELRADQLGIKILNRAGIDPRALFNVLVLITNAWESEIPTVQRKQLEKRLRSAAKLSGVDWR